MTCAKMRNITFELVIQGFAVLLGVSYCSFILKTLLKINVASLNVFL